MEIVLDDSWQSAFGTYRDKLSDIIRRFESPSILELGGGRTPSFLLEELPTNLASYTVNDISESELALTGPGYAKACFDATGDVSRFSNQYDVVFSRTLAEHVRSGKLMHENVLKLLKPGGIAFHMIPTLFCVPFVVNKLVPNAVGQGMLRVLNPHRREDHPDYQPVFKAHYSWCYGSRSRMERLLKSVGFSDVKIKTFYGHDYFRRVPLIRQVDNAISYFAWKADISAYGSYAHIMAFK